MRAALLACLALAVRPAAASACQLDVIRGRVTGPDSLPVDGARVTATAAAGGPRRMAVTGEDGRFTVTFPAGDGDYALTFAAVGFIRRALTLRRMGADNVFIADVRLQRQAMSLDTLRIRGERPRVERGFPVLDVGGTETPVSPWNLTADQLGVLAVMAASIPGVQLVPRSDGTPDGFSVLGLSPAENRATLDGMSFGASSIPRDAPVRSSVATAPYDVSRGGFSGAQQSLSLRPGSNFTVLGASLVTESPRLQWLDRAGSGLGQRYTSLSFGGSASGALRTDRAFYDVSVQLTRRWSPLLTLLTADPAGLAAEGIAPDSVARLLAILEDAGIPVSTGRVPLSQASEQGLFLGGLTLAPSSSGHALAFTVSASWNRQAPVALAPTNLPAAAAVRRDWQAALIMRHSAYFGGGLLTETALGLDRTRATVQPYTSLPSGSVRIASTLPDGSSGLRVVSFGGSSLVSGSETRTAIEARNALSWFSRDSRHRLQLTTELRHESYAESWVANRWATLTYPSLTDLAAGTPATFARQTSAPAQRGGLVTGSAALGDTWRPSPGLQFQYGARLDAGRFDQHPAPNAALVAALGVRNDRLPSGVQVSPRLGFAWTYGRAFPDLGGGGRAALRGGVGVFQGRSSATLTRAALSATGLPNGETRIACAGGEVPFPDWPAWAADPGTIPAVCAGGTTGTPFADDAPAVALLSPAFASPRSVRTNVQWSSPVWRQRLLITVEGTWSRTTRRPHTVDLNVDTSPHFTLADEADRPVFVDATGIASSTGAVAPGAARRSAAFGSVGQLRADLRAEARQLAFRLAPSAHHDRLTWSLSYVRSWYREQVSGFVSTGASPLAVTTARAARDVHHQIAWNAVFALADWVRVGVFGSIRSGEPFTPMVGGDVNGDGYDNDRAFIHDPATAPDSAVASGMAALLSHGSAATRACLGHQVGRVASHNSCTGPWVANATIALTVNPTRLGLSQRWSLSLQLANPFGAADLLLHGEQRLRGWGQPARPDQTLLYVRGFDPVSQRFRYDINPRFGASGPVLSAARTPTRLTLAVRVDLAPVRESQQLTQTLARGRRASGERADALVFRSMYATGGMPNPLALVLQLADSLRLTATQADSVARLNAWYRGQLDSIWTPLAGEFAGLPDDVDAAAAVRRQAEARSATITRLRIAGPAVHAMLTPWQRSRLPLQVARLLDPHYLASVRAGTVNADFAGPLTLPGGGLPSLGGAGSVTFSGGRP